MDSRRPAALTLNILPPPGSELNIHATKWSRNSDVNVLVRRNNVSYLFRDLHVLS